MRVLPLVLLLLIPVLQGERAYDSDPFSHVVGGVGADWEEYPFVVRVKQGGGFCTGSVVAPRRVLTAAHCVEEGDGSIATVLFEAYLPIEGIVEVHSDSRLDLALVHLNSEAPVDPVRLGGGARPGSTKLSVGYGSAKSMRSCRDGISNEGLQKAPVFVFGQISSYRIKAGQREGRGGYVECGDSGGPLLTLSLNSGPGIWSQVGVAAETDHNGNGYYVDLFGLKSWILEQTSNDHNQEGEELEEDPDHVSFAKCFSVQEDPGRVHYTVKIQNQSDRRAWYHLYWSGGGKATPRVEAGREYIYRGIIDGLSEVLGEDCLTISLTSSYGAPVRSIEVRSWD